MADRIGRAVQQIDFFLREIRRTSRAGQMSGELAMILHHLLGKNERLGVAVAFVQAIEPSDLEQLASILEASYQWER